MGGNLLSVILYDDISEVENIDLPNDVALTIVTPNPKISDAFRQQSGLSKQYQHVDVVTIPKYTKDLIDLSGLNFEVSRKADLLLELSIVWRIKAPELSYESFIKTFNTFTDLRSYTLDFEMISDMLDEFEPEEANMIKLFWYYLDEVGLIDEHRANGELANCFSVEQNILENSHIIFWGFSHMSGTQIDLIKSLSVGNDVYIPFPREVFHHSKPTDWINWLDVQDVKSYEKSNKVLAETIFFESENLNSQLNNLDIPKEKVDILLLQKSPTIRQINEIPFKGSQYRVAQEIFLPLNKKLFHDISNTFLNDDFLISELIEWVQSNLLEELKKDIESKNFRYIKLLGIFLDYILKYHEKTSQKDTLDSFDLKLLEELVELASPRTFASTINRDSSHFSVLGLESIDSIRDNSFKIVCLSKSYTSPSTDRVPYSENMAEFLSSIAPVRSNELENKILKFKLEKLALQEGLFLIEGDILDKSIGWIKLFENFDFLESQRKIKKSKKVETLNYLDSIIVNEAKPPTHWSASRLQSYHDCPRQYYFKYIDKIDTPRNLTYEILPMDLGVLEHLVIKEYVENNDKFSAAKLDHLAEEIFAKFLIDHPNYQLRKIDRENYLQEIKIYSSRASIELLKIKSIPGAQLEFEIETRWKDSYVRGSIDCLVLFPDGYFILDFKRSKYKICSLSELLNFEKIQLWFYKEHLATKDLGNFLGMGYLTLGDLNESLVHITNDGRHYFESVDFLPMTKWSHVIDNEYYDLYREFEQYLRDRACQDSLYLAKPLDSTICSYCNVKNLCPKEVGNE